MVSSDDYDNGFWPSLYEQLRGPEAVLKSILSPLANAFIKDGAYKIHVELPGINAKDVTVTVENSRIVIEGVKSINVMDAADMVFFTERLNGRFARSFTLPEDADLSAIESSMVDGVLMISVPQRDGQKLVAIHPTRVEP